MSKLYTIYAKNLYAVASTLIHLRVPFEFRPHKAYNERGCKSPYHKSTIDMILDEDKVTISDVLFAMDDKFHDIFGFEIISEA